MGTSSLYTSQVTRQTGSLSRFFVHSLVGGTPLNSLLVRNTVNLGQTARTRAARTGV